MAEVEQPPVSPVGLEFLNGIGVKAEGQATRCRMRAKLSK